MPGFGKSEEPKEAWNTDKFIELVKEFVRINKIDNITFIGHSNG